MCPVTHPLLSASFTSEPFHITHLLFAPTDLSLPHTHTNAQSHTERRKLTHTQLSIHADEPSVYTIFIQWFSLKWQKNIAKYSKKSVDRGLYYPQFSWVHHILGKNKELFHTFSYKQHAKFKMTYFITKTKAKAYPAQVIPPFSNGKPDQYHTSDRSPNVMSNL